MEDIITTMAVAAGMHTLIPDAKLALIPEAGHRSNIDQPAIFNSNMLEHLRSL
jgi:non-heme chloroperoxidase